MKQNSTERTDDNVIYLQWGEFTHAGRLELVLDVFLPCSQKNMRKLLKITDMDPENGPDVRSKLLAYCRVKRDAAEWDAKYLTDNFNRIFNPSPAESKRTGGKVRGAKARAKRWNGLVEIIEQWEKR